MVITRKRFVEGTQITEENQKLVEADLLSSSSSETYEDTASEDDDDDEDDDPTFDGTQSKFSRLSLSSKTKIKTMSRMIKDVEMKETVVPVLNEKDAKSFDTVLEIVYAGQVEKLKLEQCKVYLRKYGLRLTGKKETLILRIKEHIEIQNGDGEKKYPASSFVLNCKGDACMGDVVMFEQNVYEMFNIASRSACGPPCGTRIVAGRIVKESYGAAKQQHTFTIEVLWSKGEKPLLPLHPLLIKGRNLYRLKTLRQKWEDEGERQKVLMEKHSRGGVARSDREVRIQKKEIRKAFKANRVFKEIDPKAVQVPVKHSSSMNSGKFDKQHQQKPININNVQQAQHRNGNPVIPLNNFHPSMTDCEKLANSKGSSQVLATSASGSMVHVSARSHIGQLPKVDEVHINFQPKLSVKVHPEGSKNQHYNQTSPRHGKQLTSSNSHRPLPFSPRDVQESRSGTYFPTPLSPRHGNGNRSPPYSPTRQRSRLESSAVSYQFPLSPRHEVPYERTNQYLMHPRHGRVTNPQHVPLSPRYDQPSERRHHSLVLPSHNAATSSRYGQRSPRNNNCNPRVPPWVNQSYHKQQSCRYYTQGRCYYGDNCKFLHENR